MCLILTLCDRIVKYKEIANLSFTVHLSCEIYRFCKLGVWNTVINLEQLHVLCNFEDPLFLKVALKYLFIFGGKNKWKWTHTQKRHGWQKTLLSVKEEEDENEVNFLQYNALQTFISLGKTHRTYSRH